MCRKEVKKEKTEKRKHQERIARIRAGPMPHPHVMVEEVEDDEDDFVTNDLPDLQEEEEDEDEEEEEREEYHLEEGDKVYTVDLECEPENIRAGRNFSQRLAEAALKNSKKRDFR